MRIELNIDVTIFDEHMPQKYKDDANKLLGILSYIDTHQNKVEYVDTEGVLIDIFPQDTSKTKNAWRIAYDWINSWSVEEYVYVIIYLSDKQTYIENIAMDILKHAFKRMYIEKRYINVKEDEYIYDEDIPF